MKVDMSPEAVEARLRQVSELRDLCLYLGKSRLVGKEPEAEGADETPPQDEASAEEQCGSQS